MPVAGNSNLYDIFDSSSQNTFSDENNGRDNDPHMMPSTFSMNATGFDTMLEVLPDAMDFSLFSGNSNSNSNDNSNGNSRAASAFPHPVNSNSSLEHTQLHNGFDGIFEHSGTATSVTMTAQHHITHSSHLNNNQSSSTQPIDIANQQNGEIARLWDFNVDEFMMTPRDSNGSATISAPNTFNSELHYHSGSPPGTLPPSLVNNSQFDSFGHSINNSNFNQLLSMNIQQQSSTLFNQSASSSPRNNGSQTTLKKEDMGSGYRPSLTGRRSSSQISKTIHTEDGGIALSSTTIGNSIRKNSIVKQMSSSSLSNYKRGSNSSITDLPKKPPLQCFNCKTLKTPLWRRDSQGNTLCNACGLFQKLHGTMRPLSLKSDVIKKRNTKKRGKKTIGSQEQVDTNNNNIGASGNINMNMNSNGSGTVATKNGRSKKKSVQNSISNSQTASSIDLLSELQQNIMSNGSKFDLGIPNSPLSGSFGQQQEQESLNPNNLMTHNKRMSSMVSSAAKKSRRGSTSSNNSSSSRSSSRSVVPILPKPSPSTANQPQFNVNVNGSNSAGDSAASSPRVVSVSYNPCSPMTSTQQSIFSSSTGRPGISIPRRKSSRNHSSSSSSFMAASLQQLQHQHQHQQQQQQQQQVSQLQTGSSNSTVTMPNSWNQSSVGASPKTTRSPKAGFDLFSSPANSPGISSTVSKKSHTSLLSQQLQNSGHYQEGSIPEATASEGNTPSSSNYQQQASTMSTPQSLSLKRTSVTASPRNSYADSLLQHRGMYKDETSLSLRRQTSLGPRRAMSFKDQASQNSEIIGNGNTVSGGTTPITSVNGLSASATNTNNSNNMRGNVADELEWLKFGM